MAKAAVASAAPEGESAPEPPVTEAEDKAEPQPEDSEPSRQDRMANVQMGMMADLAYQDLFNELGLSPELRATMKESIVAYMSEAQKTLLAALKSKDQTAKDMHARTESRKAALRAELAGLLTPEELAAWDEYEPVADQIMYERIVDGQLNTLAAGLTNENRVLTSQVMAEELVREFDVFNASDEIYTMGNYNNAQARALNASLERLAGTLEADQYGQVEGFVNHALTMFEAMADQ